MGEFKESKLIPEIPNKARERIEKQTSQVRKDLEKAVYYFETIKATYPIEYLHLTEKHPEIIVNLERLVLTIKILSSDETLTDSGFINMVDEYNRVAKNVNTVFTLLKKEELSQQTATNSELNLDSLSSSEKAELKQFTKDLWNELFPATYVDKFCKWATDQIELDTWQKYALIPANGIENVIFGFINLFDINTYEELYNTLKTVYHITSEGEWGIMLKGMKLAYDNLDTDQKITPVLTLLCSMLFMFGGVSKISKLMKESKFSKPVKAIVESLVATKATTLTARYGGRILPLTILGGLTVPYLDFSS